MTIPLPAPLAIAGLALGPISTAIGAMYGIASNINDYFDKHIADMRRSANTTIEMTGRVLEAAKYGFGVGYLSSVTIIAVGQLLLGNTMAAVVTVATAATLTNPIAMTCAAIGAIIYGWNALSDEERNDILGNLSNGLEIGVEFIRSIVNFVIRTAKELMDSKVLKDLKKFITEKAALFGRSLSDVTHSTVDAISDASAAVVKRTSIAIDGTRRVAGRTTGRVGEVLTDAARVTGDTRCFRRDMQPFSTNGSVVCLPMAKPAHRDALCALRTQARVVCLSWACPQAFPPGCGVSGGSWRRWLG